MKTPAARVGVAVATLAAAVALFVLFAGGDDDTRTGSEPTRPQVGQPATDRRAPKPQAPAIERIVVRGGKPVGGVKRLEYERGEL